MARAVARGQARKVAQPIAYLGVDEKAFRKGHSYHTIVCDLERHTVEGGVARRYFERKRQGVADDARARAETDAHGKHLSAGPDTRQLLAYTVHQA